MTSTRTCGIPTAYERPCKKQSVTIRAGQWAALLVLLITIVGCAKSPKEVAVVRAIEPWRSGEIEGRVVQTKHYSIHTTVDDTAVLERFAALMEAAFAEYAKLAPPMPSVDGSVAPLAVFLFDQPSEMDAFTRKLTGRDADVYLSVGTGGYTFGDKVVCYLGSESDAHSTAAHEGFHQYVNRHFRTRLPPTIDEGLACTFENVYVSPAGSVTFDRISNPRRTQWLARAREAKTLIPLDTLILLHGGDLAGRPLALVEGYYGQCWALVRLLRDDPTYAEGFARMLYVVQVGRSPHDVGRTNPLDNVYNPSAIRPLLQRYVAPDWPKFQRDVARSVDELTRDERNAVDESAPAGE